VTWLVAGFGYKTSTLLLCFSDAEITTVSLSWGITAIVLKLYEWLAAAWA
jgi:hypothetical protein